MPSIIAIILTFVFFGLVTTFAFSKNDKKELLDLSSIFGWSSVLSLLGLALAIMLPPMNTYGQFFLAYLPLPGALAAVIAMVLGVIAYIKHRGARAWQGILLGATTIVCIVVLFLMPTGGTPFLCSNDYGCSALKNGSRCADYSTFVSFVPQKIGGVCIQPWVELHGQ